MSSAVWLCPAGDLAKKNRLNTVSKVHGAWSFHRVWEGLFCSNPAPMIHKVSKDLHDLGRLESNLRGKWIVGLCWFMLVQALSVSPSPPFHVLHPLWFSKRWGSQQQPLKNAKEDKEVDVFFRKAPLGFRMAHKQAPLKVDFLYSYSVHLQRTEQIWFWHLPPVDCFSLFSKMFLDHYARLRDSGRTITFPCIHSWFLSIICRWPTSTTKAA